MEIQVTSCEGCPFYNFDPDYDYHSCILQSYKNPHSECRIQINKNQVTITPEWCPIKGEYVNIINNNTKKLVD